ncbi:MAG: phenylalanine--tRNA ligase subunit beta [Acidobacteriaceae bacterium]|nr:phenylalanine--tRNA ligase subunit beta [Acidobacteriaceae bacterium]
MNLITPWIRSFLPELPVSDRQLAEDLTLRGIAVEGEFPYDAGTRFEMDITTNRVDAMNHYGVAREVAAIYNVALTPLTEALAAPVAEDEPGEGYPVRIEAQDLCGRFTARVIRGVTVKPASGRVAEYFAALGQKPISGPVDVTNFGWLAMGQPTHVFDLDKIEGSIVVRRARPGEVLRLLDGTERTLVADDLVIADEKKALGLAGVMGGWESRVTEETKNILVEAAWFQPATIRASSRRHLLHTDASHRFERGADFEAAPVANALITRLVVEQAGGRVVGPLVDVTVPERAAETAGRAAVALRVNEVQRHLGTTVDGSEISSELVLQYLRALGCALHPTAAGEFSVQLPSWRLDLEREIDLIEEIARVYGYNRFADTLPAFSGQVVELPFAEQQQVMRETLRGLGYSETISSTFASAEDAAVYSVRPAVAMGNPLSEEAGMLRPALTPNMAGALALNLNRGVNTVRLFELGTVFTGSTQTVDEAQSLALGATGAVSASSLYPATDALFFAVKGALETLLAKFAGATRFTAEALPSWIEPGRGAVVYLGEQRVAVFGELSASEVQKRKLRQTCVLAEVDAEALYATPLRRPLAQELSRFQAVERDFSFVFPDSVSWSAMEAAVRGLAIAELVRVEPLEIFRDAKGKAVAVGSYSALVRVVLQSAERTLTEEEIGGWAGKIVSALTALGGVQRA